ncbi:MAG: hypothetical protein ABR567_19980 [Myxococcales bacterium]
MPSITAVTGIVADRFAQVVGTVIVPTAGATATHFFVELSHAWLAAQMSSQPPGTSHLPEEPQTVRAGQSASFEHGYFG